MKQSNQASKKDIQGGAFVFIVVIVLIFGYRSCSSDVDVEKVVSSSSQPEVENTKPLVHFTKDGYIAATNEKYLDDAVSYAIDKDMVALGKLLDEGVVFFLKPDLEVFLVDAHLDGTIEIRVKGDTNTYWTTSNAIN